MKKKQVNRLKYKLQAINSIEPNSLERVIARYRAEAEYHKAASAYWESRGNSLLQDHHQGYHEEALKALQMLNKVAEENAKI